MLNNIINNAAKCLIKWHYYNHCLKYRSCFSNM